MGNRKVDASAGVNEQEEKPEVDDLADWGEDEQVWPLKEVSFLNWEIQCCLPSPRAKTIHSPL